MARIISFLLFPDRLCGAVKAVLKNAARCASSALGMFLAAAAAYLAIPANAARAAGLGGLGINVANNLAGIAKAVQMVGYVAGFTLVVMGLLELYNTGRSHDSTLKGGMTKCCVGAALLAIDALISTFSTTLFGGNESGAGLGGLGL